MLSFYSYSQETKNKLQFNSIDISPINIYFDNSNSGIAVSIALSLKKNKHIYKAFALSGSEFNISVLGPSTTKVFREFDIFYGKEFKDKKWLYLDVFGGLGYFSQTITTPEIIPGSGTSSGGFLSFTSYDYNYIKDKNNTIGLVLQSNIRFKTGKRFSLGFQFHTNINSINTIYSIGILLQWKLGSKSRLEY
ncbi:hypothetical protein [Lacinutrix jangbogonensis]|uniref:hypothetical protein n=1 Tax=Lacinutrix jangbogonensis TaxID=1469557 RepID=UPI00053D0D87|nr:hypothetical protein [Lacinutrix jangbogonensis]